MIFIGKVAEFWDKVFEDGNKSGFEKELQALRDEVRELRLRMEFLEKSTHQHTTVDTPKQREFVYEPAPYWTNPNWNGYHVTCGTSGYADTEDASDPADRISLHTTTASTADPAGGNRNSAGR